MVAANGSAWILIVEIVQDARYRPRDLQDNRDHPAMTRGVSVGDGGG